MNTELNDIQSLIRSLAEIQHTISEISDLSFASYDSRGIQLLPPRREDGLTTTIRSHPTGREEYDKYISQGVKRAVLRKEASILRGPASQHNIFIPVDVSESRFVLVSSPFYVTKQDFDDFLKRRGRIPDLSSGKEAFPPRCKLKDSDSAQQVAVHVKKLFETLLTSVYERNQNSRRYLWTKTLTDVLLNMKLPVPIDDAHRMILDTILFLFNVNTASIMVKRGVHFETVLALGSMNDVVGSFRVREDSPALALSVKKLTQASIVNPKEILTLGLPGDIKSVNVFPLSSHTFLHGLIMIFNSSVSRDEAQSILEFCRLSSLILKNLSIENDCDRYVNNLTMLNVAVSKIDPRLNDPASLHRQIVMTATELLQAEKGSLILPENGDLVIKAVRGINEWLTRNIRLKPGVGISGMVFKEGRPMLVRNIDRIELPDHKQRFHYRKKSFISMPLQFSSETIGVLNITDRLHGDEFTEQDLNILKHFGTYAAIALKVFSYHRLAEQMKELSITDHLTGLYNRRYLQERFSEEIHRSDRYKLSFSVGLIDIDDFKIFNDSEGHLAGDGVLRDLAHIARENSRANDVIARIGGEEFAILMPQTDRDEAFLVSERIRKTIMETLTQNWKKFPRSSVTVSIGISTFPHHGKTVQDMIEKADLALYRAKAMGKNRTVIFEEELRRREIP